MASALEKALDKLTQVSEELIRSSIYNAAAKKEEDLDSAAAILQTMIREGRAEETTIKGAIEEITDELQEADIDIDSLKLEHQTTDAHELLRLANEGNLELLGGMFQDNLQDLNIAHDNLNKLKQTKGQLNDIQFALSKADPGEDYKLDPEDLQAAYKEHYLDTLGTELSAEESAVAEGVLANMLGPEKIHELQLAANERIVARAEAQVAGVQAEYVSDKTRIEAHDFAIMQIEDARKFAIAPVFKGVGQQFQTILTKESELLNLDATNETKYKKDLARINEEIRVASVSVGSIFYPWAENSGRLESNENYKTPA